jgi:hypothetical protein
MRSTERSSVRVKKKARRQTIVAAPAPVDA